MMIDHHDNNQLINQLNHNRFAALFIIFEGLNFDGFDFVYCTV